MFSILELTGLVAASLTTLAFLPQVMQTWRSRSTAGLNLPMLVVLATGIALWTIYGLGTRQLPVILANAVTLCLVAILLGLKLRDTLRGMGPEPVSETA
jgi:MtN3 and saliva related transmembrane protein